MTDLTELLKERIAGEGPIAVHDFMEAALTHPEHGYYTGRMPLGADGDFITAPEVSQMFGELVGLWCAVMWQAMGGPDPLNLVELGPGRGTLMADALRAASALPPFRAALRLHLVEISPVLRRHQEEALADTGVSVTWHASLETVPAGPMVLVANEFFDALSIRQYVRSGDGWCERLVDAGRNGGGFRFVLEQPLAQPPVMAPGLLDAPEGSIVEVCPGAMDMVRTIGRRVAEGVGAALVIDYGHAESSAGDTLQAVRGHAYSEVLDGPGTADLTAHVDFASLSRAAYAGGAEVHGPVTQAAFLGQLGIQERGEALLGAAVPEQHEEILSAHRRLVHPEEMGILFKVLALTHPDLPDPPGFI